MILDFQGKTAAFDVRVRESWPVPILQRGIRNPLITKIAAAWLAVLVFLPFTPPFTTCDFGDVVGLSSSDQSVPLPVLPRNTTAAAMATALLVMPLPTLADQLKNLAMFSLTSQAVRSPRPTLDDSAASNGRPVGSPALVPVLRL